MTKVQPPTAAGGRVAKDSFAIDLRADTVTCPNRLTAPIRRANAGGGSATFGAACATRPLAAQCTTSPAGRTITIHPREAELTRARARQADPAAAGGGAGGEDCPISWGEPRLLTLQLSFEDGYLVV
jgi:hypothetical protein